MGLNAILYRETSSMGQGLVATRTPLVITLRRGLRMAIWPQLPAAVDI